MHGKFYGDIMAVRLKAFVGNSTGRARHAIGTIVDGKPVAVTEIPNPEWLEIAEEGDAFYLYHFSSEGVCIADTWHSSLTEAKQQAQHEFGISPEDWVQAFENLRAP
ncbi:MAG TPA: hypothetical protein VNH11_17465 [Pirellulales bacterium]|nr:hypothetical protein [Pirellulales bacterium]